MSRNYAFALNEYYHIFARGFDKSIIFSSDLDKIRFQQSLYLLNTSRQVCVKDIRKSNPEVYSVDTGVPLVAIGAYSLMDNHFHILIKEVSHGGISKFMQKLMTSHTMSYNSKYNRKGRLFSSSFKAVHVRNDAHLRHLFDYIHDNPRELFLGEEGQYDQKIFEKYSFSSRVDYAHHKRSEWVILNKTVFPDYSRVAQVS